METKVQFSIKKDDKYAGLFSDSLVEFLVALHTKFNPLRKELLLERKEKQEKLDQGELPSFPEETAEIRLKDWKCAPIPRAIQDRRVEITGPVERKMMINALNSGANCFMADLEDATSPTWESLMEGQVNLKEAVDKTLSYRSPEGKEYILKPSPAQLMVRPRGLHMEEKHLDFDGERGSASLIDFGIFFFTNVKTLVKRNEHLYLYLPKIEYYQEARFWNDVFEFSQDYLGLEKGVVRVTVLIETLSAAFELDEILYELKDHIVGLNCGRWDYIFSYIKKLKRHPEFLVPDRAQVTMTSPFMSAYSQKVIEVCHRRGVFAMGGMAAQIPVKNDPEHNERSLEKVRADKEREVRNGHDGTWVAHPALVPIAKEVFDHWMPTPNQIESKRQSKLITASDLLEVPKGTITAEGLRENIRVGILYIESWLMGRGAAALYHLMEDAATAEISRSQVWQWLYHQAKLEDGTFITKDLVHQLIEEEMRVIQTYVGEERYENGKFNLAREVFEDLVFAEEFKEFLTVEAYPHL